MMDMDLLQRVASKIKDVKNKYTTDLGVISTYEGQKSVIEEKIIKLNIYKEEINTKVVILQEASTEARDNAKDLLRDVSSNAVQMVLGDNLSIDIILDKKANVATAEVITKVEYVDEIIETDPAEEEGGGLADVVSLSSFWSIGGLAGRENLAPKFLDEPTKYLNGHSEKVAIFIKEMVDYTERQTFLVTHDEHVSSVGDIAYRLALDEKGVTKTEKVS